MKKHCLVCNKEFRVTSAPYSTNRKYCNRKCYVISMQGKKVTWGDKISKGKMGHGWPEGYHERQSIAQKKRFETDNVWNKGLSYGKAKWFWKGKPNAYRSLHKKISRVFGTPNKCEHCERDDLIRYEWANVSGNYTENRTDWLRLCKKCHFKHDKIYQNHVMDEREYKEALESL